MSLFFKPDISEWISPVKTDQALDFDLNGVSAFGDLLDGLYLEFFGVALIGHGSLLPPKLGHCISIIPDKPFANWVIHGIFPVRERQE